MRGPRTKKSIFHNNIWRCTKNLFSNLKTKENFDCRSCRPNKNPVSNKRLRQCVDARMDDTLFLLVCGAYQIKTIPECLQIVTGQLSHIRCSQPQPYQNDTIMQKKLLHAIRNFPRLCFAYQKPSPTVRGIIADLQS